MLNRNLPRSTLNLFSSNLILDADIHGQIMNRGLCACVKQLSGFQEQRLSGMCKAEAAVADLLQNGNLCICTLENLSGSSHARRWNNVGCLEDKQDK